MVGTGICGVDRASELAQELARAQEPAQPVLVGEVVLGVGSHGECARSTKLAFRLTILSTSSCSSQQSPGCSRKEARLVEVAEEEDEVEEEDEDEEVEAEEAEE